MKPELIVALDVDSEKKARALVDALAPDVKFFKVGSVLFTQCGPSIVEYIAGKNARIFLDLKFHDIPNTVRAAAAAGAALPGVFMMTLHTLGGSAMLEAAATGVQQKSKEIGIKKPALVGVTVLTSESFSNVAQEVLRRAKIAKDAGLDGVVCAVHEAAAVRHACGSDFIIVTPGIRAKGAAAGDQKRVATVEDARNAGVDYIVVGRPIIEAADPRKAAQHFQAKAL